MRFKISIVIFMLLILLPIPTLQKEILNNIVWTLDGQVIENSMTVELNECNQYSLKEIKNNINKLSNSNLKVDILDDALALEGKIYINITSEDINSDFNQLKNNILTSINTKDTNVKTYYCTKGKIHDNDYKYVAKLENVLQIIGSKKINVVKSNEGYFGTAYTGYFQNSINTNEKLDMNFSINEYTSGTYVIIGTPIIACIY